ncbi:MAG: hypothetical protein Q7T33_07145 [Dehalococcoidia bacterium]|nr:hypothetical protein [Dehalococcoidia bacterium]
MSIAPEIGELARGLRVVTTQLPTAQTVSVNAFVGGSRGENSTLLTSGGRRAILPR